MGDRIRDSRTTISRSLTVLIIACFSAPCPAIIMHGRYLTFHGSPDTCITITSVWDAVDSIRVIVGTEVSLSTSDTVTSFSGLRRHHVELNGLQPATRYYYKIQDKIGIDHTDVDSFKTANILGFDENLTLLLVSDFQPSSSTFGQAERDSIRGFIDTLRTQIAQNRCPYPDLILNLGDFVNAATSADWDTIIAILDTLHELAPLLPTIGNHDGFPKGRLDSCGYVYHFNLPPSGIGDSWAGSHQYVLDYQNVRFISLSVCDAWRTWDQDRVTHGSSQYAWLDSCLSTVPTSIDLVVEMHHVNLTPLPWNRQNGAPDTRIMTWQNGIYDDPSAQNTPYDTLRYEYYRYIRPLLETSHAISIEGHAWFSSATTPLASSIYFGNLPLICCAGGNGWNTNKQSFCVMYISADEIQVDYHKVDSWPDAAAVVAGYPWQEAATQRIFTIYECPTHLLGLYREIPTVTIQWTTSRDGSLHYRDSRSESPGFCLDDPNGISMCWAPIRGAVQYYIYQFTEDCQNQWTLTDSTASTNYRDSWLVPGRIRCFYRVTADPDAGIAPLNR